MVKLRCNRCRRIIDNEELIEKILEQKNEYQRQFFLKNQDHGVGECPFDGCHGELFYY